MKRQYHIRPTSRCRLYTRSLEEMDFDNKGDAKDAIGNYGRSMPCPEEIYELRGSTRIEKSNV